MYIVKKQRVRRVAVNVAVKPLPPALRYARARAGSPAITLLKCKYATKLPKSDYG